MNSMYVICELSVTQFTEKVQQTHEKIPKKYPHIFELMPRL